MERRRANWTGLCTEYSPLAAGSIDGTDEEPHDRGIVRAMNAKYKPNKGVTGDPYCTVFVGRLHPKTSEETLRQVFAKFGDIKRVSLIRDIVTGFSKCYAFIEFNEKMSAEEACFEANKLVVDNMEILVDIESERTLKGWVPRRLGGGFGGKKESGQLRFGGRDRPFREPFNIKQQEERPRYSRDGGISKHWGQSRSRARPGNEGHARYRGDGNSGQSSDSHYRDRDSYRDRDRSRRDRRDRDEGR